MAIIGEAYFTGLITINSILIYKGDLCTLEDVETSRTGRKVVRRFKLRNQNTQELVSLPYNSEITL